MRRVYAYARVSSKQQADHLPAQAEALTAFGRRLADEVTADEMVKGTAMWAHCRQEVISATEVPWNRRREMRKLMDEMTRGDYLVVAELKRIDRHGLRLYEAFQWFNNVGIDVHVMDLGGTAVSLSSYFGRMMVTALGMTSEMEGEVRSEATRRGQHAAIQAGFTTGRWPPIGTRLKSHGRNGRYGRKYWVWDATECAQIMEIWQRHVVEGESIRSIGRDFHKRGLRTAKGHLWCPVTSRGNKYRPYPSYVRLRTVIKYRQSLLDAGTDLMVAPPNPKMVNDE